MITTLAFLASAALAGQPGGTDQPAPRAPSAPTMAAAAPNPGTAAIPGVQNAPWGRPAFEIYSACPSLTTAHPQQMRPDTAAQLQAGSTQALLACGQFVQAQAGAFSQQALATAGAALVNPVRVTTTAPDGGKTVTEPIGDTTPDYARVDAVNGTVTVANGAAATFAAASNGGQAFPMGAMGWGTGNGAWGPMMGASAAVTAGVGQPTVDVITPPPAAPQTPATRATNPPPATTTTVQAAPNPEAAEAILRAGQR